MQRAIVWMCCCAVLLCSFSAGLAQEAEPAGDDLKSKASDIAETAKEKAGVIAGQTEEKVREYAKQVDESEKAQEITAGILQPIYQLAEHFSFPAFHWIAFMLMATGVVSWALQLVLGKLIVLSQGGFSMAEIISDAVVLVISVVGLVLTTQAAAENSTFTQSAASVLSATAVGAFAGFILYWWGQRQELEAVKGRTKSASKSDD